MSSPKLKKLTLPHCKEGESSRSIVSPFMLMVLYIYDEELWLTRQLLFSRFSTGQVATPIYILCGPGKWKSCAVNLNWKKKSGSRWSVEGVEWALIEKNSSSTNFLCVWMCWVCVNAIGEKRQKEAHTQKNDSGRNHVAGGGGSPWRRRLQHKMKQFLQPDNWHKCRYRRSCSSSSPWAILLSVVVGGRGC